MLLYNRLNIKSNKSELVSMVGAGGKTSFMFKLAKELKSLGKKILVTTTTAIFYPQEKDFDKILVCDSEDLNILQPQPGNIIVLGREVSSENKLLGVRKEFIEEIYNKGLFDYILVEADGAKRKSIKAAADHEPVIPRNTSKTIGVIGLDCIDKTINSEHVHRPEIFCAITGSCIGDKINENNIVKLITDEKGTFKCVPPGCEKYLLLNKIESYKSLNLAYKIIAKIKESPFRIDGIIAGSLMSDNYLNIAPESYITGIIMASGFSSRMNRDKLTLKIGGISMVERVIKTAIQSDINEVILVYRSDEVKKIGQKYGIKTVYNPKANRGQSEAVKLGVQSSNDRTNGYMFLPADQPFLIPEIINQLIFSFNSGNYPIVIPIYNDKQGNPAIISSKLKTQLLNLQGDNGARVLMNEIPTYVKRISISEAYRGIDIDTPEEYNHIKDRI